MNLLTFAVTHSDGHAHPDLDHANLSHLDLLDQTDMEQVESQLGGSRHTDDGYGLVHMNAYFYTALQ